MLHCQDCKKELKSEDETVVWGLKNQLPTCGECASKEKAQPVSNIPTKFKTRNERQDEAKNTLLLKFKESPFMTMKEFIDLVWEEAYDWGWTVRDEDGDDEKNEPWDPHEMD